MSGCRRTSRPRPPPRIRHIPGSSLPLLGPPGPPRYSGRGEENEGRWGGVGGLAVLPPFIFPPLPARPSRRRAVADLSLFQKRFPFFFQTRRAPTRPERRAARPGRPPDPRSNPPTPTVAPTRRHRERRGGGVACGGSGLRSGPGA